MSAVATEFARTPAEPFTQEGRLLAIETPLGKDHLLLTSVNGEEALSRLFTYQIEMLSADHAITPESLIGRNVKLLIATGDEDHRSIHGVTSRFFMGPTTVRNYRLYRAEIVPWPWFLTQTSDCRIFQNLNIPDILSEVFETFGFKDYEMAVSKPNYPKLEFCVQYRETAFNFASRLMEQAGIYYFFRHEEDRHVLVIADKNTTFCDLRDAKLAYAPNNGQSGEVTAWEHSYQFRSGRWAQTDFDFEAPAKSLLTRQPTLLRLPGADGFERFDYPGGYAQHDDGAALTRTLMETEEAAYHAVRGASRYPFLAVGGRFELDSHPCGPEGRYVVKSVSQDAADPTYFGNADAKPYYANSFEAIPYDVPFRPPRRTVKPVVHGPQTAIVVGPPGERIFTDKYGRVRVQFHWDRYGKHDDKSSCWIRVSQAWAGHGWGSVNLPHIGHEVVVSFLEGDPDHPLITGRVYNGGNLKAMAMPENRTQSAISDHSGNELVMESKSGAEDLRITAAKDTHVVVAHDYDETVKKGNRTITITAGTYTHSVDAKTAERTSSGENLIRSSKANVQIEAATTIQLHVGASSLTMDKGGKVQITANDIILDAKTISLSGQTSVETTGGQVNSTAQGTHTIKGALVKIN